MKIVFLTRVFSMGGAERQLAIAARELSRRGHDVTIIVLSGRIELCALVEDSGVHVISVDKGARWNIGGWIFRLGLLLRRLRPSVLVGWLPPESLIGFCLSRFFSPMPFVWAVRSSNIDLLNYDYFTRVVYRVHRRLIAAGVGESVFFNSHAGANFFGLTSASRRTEVIWNAIDSDIFQYRPECRAAIREELSLAKDAPVVAILGRMAPEKDHATFVRAARRISNSCPSAVFLVVGREDGNIRAKIECLIEDLSLTKKFIFLGPRADINRIINAVDVVVSTSVSEGVQNTIIEAMACGCPVVATDAGDVSLYALSSDPVVPIGDDEAVAEATLSLLSGAVWPRRIERQRHTSETFSVDRLGVQMEKFLQRTFDSYY